MEAITELTSAKASGLLAAPDMNVPLRPAWVEIDLRKLRANYRAILAECPPGASISMVVKDDAYGHGAVEVARVAMQAGAKFLVVSNLAEALELREANLMAPILLLGERHEDELPACIEYQITCAVSDLNIPLRLAKLRKTPAAPIAVQVKVDTGMSRYGVRWEVAAAFIIELAKIEGITIEGILSHFAMSDEEDKTYATVQLNRFQEVIRSIEQRGIKAPLKHFCNSGGFLDLPQAHFQMVRLGILPLGVYPSQVCRRIPGIEPVMTIKSRLAKIREIEKGESVGYGMRYTAAETRRVAVLPMGYGDGYPRVRNEGFALVRGRKAPIIGGVSMDAITIDVTGIPDASQWDEAVLMGSQGEEQITVQQVAALKRSVSYDVLTNWRHRLPRVYLS